MKEFCGVVCPGDYDTYVKDGLIWEAMLSERITGDKNNGGGRLTLKGGAELPEHVRSDMEELWFLVSGACNYTVWSEDGSTQETRTLSERDLVYLRKNQKRYVRNAGIAPAVFMIFFPSAGPELEFLRGDDVIVLPATNREEV